MMSVDRQRGTLLGLADSIASVGWDLNDQARRYVAWWRKGEYSVNGRCFDIGFTTSSALSRFEQTGDARNAGDPSPHASGNGSIMRLAPVPIRHADLFHDELEELVRYCIESSLPTHASPQCLSACAYFGLVLCGLIHGIDRAEQPPQIVGSGYVVKSLEAALWAFHDVQDFQEAVLRAVNLGDDADTTGAVCGQLAGAYWGESGIPAEWLEGLAKRDMIEKALAGLMIGNAK